MIGARRSSTCGRQPAPIAVIPAKAGIHKRSVCFSREIKRFWIRASAGMTMNVLADVAQTQPAIVILRFAESGYSGCSKCPPHYVGQMKFIALNRASAFPLI